MFSQPTRLIQFHDSISIVLSWQTSLNSQEELLSSIPN